jgi:hypothetical protein
MRENHEWVDGKTPEELDAIEFSGRTLFKDHIRRIKKDGTHEDVPILVRCPRPVEIMAGRLEAITLFKKQGLDREKDNDLFDQLDTLAVLSKAIRDPKPPHDQFQTLEFLISHKPGEGFDIESLMDVWTRLETYRRLLDPRITEVSEDDAIRAALAIERVRNVSPLAAIAGHELDGCIVTMACMLVTSLRQLQSAQSSVTSRPAT